jgi:hypothetical protein
MNEYDIVPTIMGIRIESVTETRNSPIRKVTAETINIITRKLHESLPGLTANDITILGVAGTAIGSAIAAFRRGDHSPRDNALTAVSITTTIASQLGDAFDGPMARLRIREGGAPDPNGQFIDVASDRAGELLSALSRSISAEKRHDTLGKIAALTVAVTSPWPSTARAMAEAKGVAVPENGKGIIGLAGTRLGRAFLGILALEFPEIHGVPIQVIADALSAAANSITTAHRLKEIKMTPATLSQEIQNDAKKRLKLLVVIGAISATAAVATYGLFCTKK